jgi:FtsZ-interacting cell division protein ZipA
MNMAHVSPMAIWLAAVLFVSLTLLLVIWRSKDAQRRRQSRFQSRIADSDAESSEVISLAHIAAEDSLIMLRLMANNERPYRGYELLQALLSAGLRYDGRQKIFHRYALPNGRGRCLFSLASVQSPGVFDMDTMGGYSCPGLVVFFQSAQSTAPSEDYKLMVDAAKQLIEDLGGSLLGSDNQVFDGSAYAETLTKLNDASMTESCGEEQAI